MKDGRVTKRTRRRSGSINDENWVIDRHLGDDGFCTKTTMAVKHETILLLAYNHWQRTTEDTERAQNEPRS